MKNLIIVGNTADSPFAVDMGHHLKQQEDYSDLISLKGYKNSEFCPRFIVDEEDWENIGDKLKDKKILIVSTGSEQLDRNSLAMRNFLIARAAKDNGAKWVMILEPDLYYSAQDRGPREEHGVTDIGRDRADYQKFDGQPFSARLYAELLSKAGVDEVVTVHNHSLSVKNIFMDRFMGRFHNILPADLYADYIVNSDIANEQNLLLCAPDKGAVPFIRELKKELNSCAPPLLVLDKTRKDEFKVELRLSQDSECSMAEVAGRDVIVVDDMVRTGNTIAQCCLLLKQYNPRRIIFLVTHFYSSIEGRIILNTPAIDEIVTTNTIPDILNRDKQGRLRKKMVVLKIERWLTNHIHRILNLKQEKTLSNVPLYIEDMSSKNPRWKGQLGPLFTQRI